MRYDNLDLWIDRMTADGYPLRAISSKGLGEARAVLPRSALDAQLLDMVEHVGGQQVDRALLEALGTRLYQELLRGEIDMLFQRCWGDAQAGKDCGFRLRLRIEPPELAVLPWELLRSPSFACFLGTVVRVPLVRYLELNQPIRRLETRVPIKMLVAVPEAYAPYPALDAAAERGVLTRATEGLAGIVETVFVEHPVTLDAISDLLLQGEFHCFHFIGHGVFKDDTAFLLLDSGRGSFDSVDAERFAGVFANHEAMKLLVLNSCMGAALSSTQPLVGMAPELVKRGIPAVVGMHYAVYDDVAVRFAREFYLALFKGANRGRVDAAMSHARNRLAGEFPDEAALATPVLFMRAGEGLLFDLVTGSVIKDNLLGRGFQQRVHDAIKTTTDNIDTLTGQRTEAGDASVDEALAAEKDALERLKGRIRVRNHCLLAGSLTILIAVLISWVGLFDWAGLDTKVETYTLGLRDLVAGGAQGLDERIVTVVIDRESEQALGKPFDRSWRHEHARLLDELSGAGARVVAFDLHFKEPSPEADAALSGALKRARERGTAVIIGFADVAGGVPVVAASLREAVEGFGVVCLGSREGYGMLLPLLVTQEAGDVPPFPSLALRAYLAFRDGWDRVWMDKDSRSVWWWPRGGQEPAKIPFSRVDNVRSAQPECGTIGPGDKVAQLILDPTPLGELRTGAHHYAYHEVALGRLTPARRDGLAGKIVLVGRGATRDVDDVHTVQPGFAGENRYGWELHADALNTLLTGTAIRPLGVWVQSGIMTVMAFIGAFLNYFIPPRYRRGQRLLLAAVSVCYLAIALWLCVRHGLLVNTLYHLVALWVAYWVAKRVKGGLPHVV